MAEYSYEDVLFYKRMGLEKAEHQRSLIQGQYEDYIHKVHDLGQEKYFSDLVWARNRLQCIDEAIRLLESE